MEYILAGLLMGIMGSFHCAGMCGPIVLAIPLPGDAWYAKVIGLISYHLGRTLTYTIMGLVFGLIGLGFSLAGIQRWVAMGTGIVMVLSVLLPYITKKRLFSSTFSNSVTSLVQKLFFPLLNKKSWIGLFLAGAVNGLLPCGLVYVALGSALALGGIVPSTLFMISFGLATAPMLIAISLAGSMVTKRIKTAINKAIPVMVLIVGLLFILRGANLGIPFLSPPMKKMEISKENTTSKVPPCCRKHQSN